MRKLYDVVKGWLIDDRSRRVHDGMIYTLPYREAIRLGKEYECSR